jgi:hypothetical protein
MGSGTLGSGLTLRAGSLNMPLYHQQQPLQQYGGHGGLSGGGELQHGAGGLPGGAPPHGHGSGAVTHDMMLQGSAGTGETQDPANDPQGWSGQSFRRSHSSGPPSHTIMPATQATGGPRGPNTVLLYSPGDPPAPPLNRHASMPSPLAPPRASTPPLHQGGSSTGRLGRGPGGTAGGLGPSFGRVSHTGGAGGAGGGPSSGLSVGAMTSAGAGHASGSHTGGALYGGSNTGFSRTSAGPLGSTSGAHAMGPVSSGSGGLITWDSLVPDLLLGSSPVADLNSLPSAGTSLSGGVPTMGRNSSFLRGPFASGGGLSARGGSGAATPTSPAGATGAHMVLGSAGSSLAPGQGSQQGIAVAGGSGSTGLGSNASGGLFQRHSSYTASASTPASNSVSTPAGGAPSVSSHYRALGGATSSSVPAGTATPGSTGSATTSTGPSTPQGLRSQSAAGPSAQQGAAAGGSATTAGPRSASTGENAQVQVQASGGTEQPRSSSRLGWGANGQRAQMQG